MNLQKYRQIQIALEHAEERADEAENSLVRVKSKIRVNGIPTGIAQDGYAIKKSQTTNQI